MSADDDYFTNVDTKPAIRDVRSADKATHDVMSPDDADPELILNKYKSAREKRLTPVVNRTINCLFEGWCSILLSGLNICVTGGQSKFALLETFRKLYLDKGRVPNFSRPDAKNGDSLAHFKSVVLHGMEPIDLDTFHHGLLGIKEKRKVIDKDYKNFIANTKRDNLHYCFVLYSFELFLDECEDIFDVIVKLYLMDPERVHIVLSLDNFNAGKKLKMIKNTIRLIFIPSLYEESYFTEKLHIGHGSAIALPEDGRLPVNRLLEGQSDLQAIKDTYQALGTAQGLMVYVIDQFVKFSEFSKDEHYLDTRDILKVMQATFAIRRANILRQHIKELEDHRVLEYDEANHRVRCIVQLGTCKKFLQHIEELKGHEDAG